MAPGKRFKFLASGPTDKGRLSVYAEPHPEKTYVCGLDFGYGLPAGDCDAGIILDNNGEQAATIEGRWGPTEFEQRLIPLLDWYSPFIVGERQVGLPVLRCLYDRGYWLYFHRKEDSRGMGVRDSLGHHAAAGDLRIPTLQEAIAPRNANGDLLPSRITLHDAEVLAQLSKFGYRPRSRLVEMDDARDRDLVMGAPHGEHDDLVMALAYAVMGMGWMAQYERPKPKFEAGTMGQILNFDAVLNPEPENQRGALASLAGGR